jgi:hypothetical protein
LNGQKESTPQQQEEWERRKNKYYTYAQVFRNLVMAYDQKKFGNLTEEEITQGKNRRWEFSIREIRRSI